MPWYWMSAEQLAEHFGVPLKTIYGWNLKRTGPPGYKLGRHLKFRSDEVEAWAAAQAVEPKGA